MTQRLLFLSGQFSKILWAAVMSLTLGLVACNANQPTAKTGADTGIADSTAAVPQSAASKAVSEKVYVTEGAAIGGADPVAYFSGEAAVGQFVAGSAEHTVEWQGVTWQFASPENREKFANNPEQYAPQYGGYCAWAAAQNAIAAIDPKAWSIVDGKLYLNASPKIQKRWQEDAPGNIAKADRNWPALSAP